MYLLLILFFASLISIVIMMGRKLFLLQNGQIASSSQDENSFEVPHLEKVKHFTIQNLKKYEHMLLVQILWLYVRSSNFLKSKYQELKIKINNKIKTNHIGSEKKEISKFLKIIGDYKHKIKEIKHKIRKEEDL
ncbi:hypothetical protein A3A03_02105 [Candidatus Nomurabacteria bacterium RIFCSPLOWO2_01_FULL_40_18]|uniref:Uncharacterized protein n=1 Tax=Candidatus Nomurabacteria bacterium RIFCSPLOWO2_01_FULL_40_18 TaxID=1801773 RepID=A0A1F6XKI0_9BACT|nr:MAG: hypothetical protein A3A03_02105 [Candidatus Nomurabacteria bacterium RIFCSPLOWO2_01_FULL_40_18]